MGRPRRRRLDQLSRKLPLCSCKHTTSKRGQSKPTGTGSVISPSKRAGIFSSGKAPRCCRSEAYGVTCAAFAPASVVKSASAAAPLEGGRTGDEAREAASPPTARGLVVFEVTSSTRDGLGDRGVDRGTGGLAGFHRPSMTAETGGSANRNAREARRSSSSELAEGLLRVEVRSRRPLIAQEAVLKPKRLQFMAQEAVAVYSPRGCSSL